MTEAYDSAPQRARWSSEGAFVFSMAAAAIGLGNLWRFPYMVGENGGAAFILAYLVALIGIGLPVMMLEVGTGRLAQGSAVRTFRQTHRWGAAYGWAVVLLTTGITSYYLVITGWTLGFAVEAATLRLGDFDTFTQGYKSLWYFLATVGLSVAVLLKGVTALERLSKMLMPVLLLIIIGLVIVAARTEGWSQARDFLLQADFSRLRELPLWLAAFGQAFYTLAIGQGYLITYGSYIPRRTHVPRACIIVAGTETAVALLAGWMIFPLVFTFGGEPGQGSQLAFQALPQAFDRMTGGAAVAIPFFVLFFAAAFSSSLAGLKVIIAAVEEETRLGPRGAVLAVGAAMLALGLPSALSFTPLDLSIAGEPVLEVIDQAFGTQLVIASGVIGAGLFAWFVPRRRIASALGSTNPWWEWRILIVSRALPLAAAAGLVAAAVL